MEVPWSLPSNLCHDNGRFGENEFLVIECNPEELQDKVNSLSVLYSLSQKFGKEGSNFVRLESGDISHPHLYGLKQIDRTRKIGDSEINHKYCTV